MKRPLSFLLILGSLVLPAAGASAAAPGWKSLSSGEISIKSRDLPGSRLKEIWAEGRLAAPVQDVQATLMDSESFPAFMPYVRYAKLLAEPGADGSHLVYTRLDPPFVAQRDYVLRVKLDQGVARDGSGEFKNHWEAVPGRIREFRKVVRIDKNSGSWHATPHPKGGSQVTYRAVVDPGSKLPGFVARSANRKGVLGTLKAVEKEARRRQGLREAQASAGLR